MTKGLTYYLRQAWKKPDPVELRRKMVIWRSGNRITKVEKPTRIDKARALGYKAKKGFVIVRVVIQRGGRKRVKPVKGRKTRRQTNKKVLKMNYRWVAEQRAQNKFKNLEILNSYMLAKDGKYYFFEIILIAHLKTEKEHFVDLHLLQEKAED
jgi:large subunit ribosomal protein L15e